MARSAVAGRGLPNRLAPEFEVDGQRVVLKPHEAGAIDARALRRPVASLRAQSHRLVDALDAVISGV